MDHVILTARAFTRPPARPLLPAQLPLSQEEVEQQAAAPVDKLALGGAGGFSLGGPSKHRIEKTRALVVLPGGRRVPLPCPDLPEMVLQVIEAVVVSVTSGGLWAGGSGGMRAVPWGL